MKGGGKKGTATKSDGRKRALRQGRKRKPAKHTGKTARKRAAEEEWFDRAEALQQSQLVASEAKRREARAIVFAAKLDQSKKTSKHNPKPGNAELGNTELASTTVGATAATVCKTGSQKALATQTMTTSNTSRVSSKDSCHVADATTTRALSLTAYSIITPAGCSSYSAAGSSSDSLDGILSKESKSKAIIAASGQIASAKKARRIVSFAPLEAT